MPVSTTNIKREYWYAQNISTKSFSLGDLPFVPSLAPGNSIDLLSFYKAGVILQSESLLTAATNGWLQITKVMDGVSTVISGTNILAQLADYSVYQVDELGAAFDGGGTPITGTKKVWREVPSSGVITSVTLLADIAGSAVLDIKKANYANWPTVTSITGSNQPTLSTTQKYQDKVLSTWTTSVTAGDILEFDLVSSSTVTLLQLFIQIRRSN